MNYPSVQIHLSMNSYTEFVRESRLETPAEEFERRLICNCTVDSDSDDIVKASKGQVSVSLVTKDDYEQEVQIGRLSQPQLDDGRLLCANIRLSEDEFLRFVDFVRAYSESCVRITIGVWSSEVPEVDIYDGKWDKRPILEIQTFSYCSTPT